MRHPATSSARRTLARVGSIFAFITACARAVPPPVAHPATVAETEPAPATAPTPTPFECPMIAAPDGAETDIRRAGLLRAFFSALVGGAPIAEFVREPAVDWTGGALVRRVRAERACPRSYASGVLAFDAAGLGEVPVVFSTHQATSARPPGLFVDVRALEETRSRGHVHATLRAYLTAHPEETPSATEWDDVSLVLLRRTDDATLCIAQRDPAGVVRCYRTSAPIRGARLLVERDDDSPEPPRVWVAVDGVTFTLGEGGALRAARKAPGGRWLAVGAAEQKPPRRGRRGSVALLEVPVADVPVSAFVQVGPREAASEAGSLLLAEELLCVRLDGTWRCTDAPWIATAPRPHVLAPVRGATLTVVPVELSRCDGGSELTECTRELLLLSATTTGLHAAASLPLGAATDEHLRELDDDDAGARVVGSREEYRWRHVLEAPLCVRMVRAEHTQEQYSAHFRDGARPRFHRRGQPAPERYTAAPERYTAAPDELPRRTSTIDPYADPPDLRGLWQLRGERWTRVQRCDP